MSVQFINHNDKPEYAVLPFDEYQLLLKRAEVWEDNKTFDLSLLSDEETIPLEVVERLIDENQLLVWREYRGLSQADLANRSGVSVDIIQQIETSQTTGSVAELKALAGVLSLDIDDLVAND